MGNIKDIIITELPIITTVGGDVMHCLKKNDPSFDAFGEAYFSCINFNSIKAWKKHKKMTLNLTVPIGNVLFVLFSNDFSDSKEIIVVEDNYIRLTIPPGIWFGFKGLSEKNIILNIANIIHDDNEVKKVAIDFINYKWENI